MKYVRINCENQNASKADIEAVEQILNEHNFAEAGNPHCDPVRIFVRDDQNNIVGGLIGSTFWGILNIISLAVKSELRGKGVGSALLLDAEKIARQRNCHSIVLHTFNPKAIEFYVSRGFEICGSIDNFPPGFTSKYMRKSVRINTAEIKRIDLARLQAMREYHTSLSKADETLSNMA